MRIRVFLMRDVFWCGASVKRHFLPTLEMIALETWRDQNSEAYFVTDSVMMDRFRLGWVYIITLDPPEQTRLPGSPIFSNRSSEARNHCQ